MIGLRSELPRLLPKAVSWAEAQQADILATGAPLSAEHVVMAGKVGVAHPENIRIKLVERLPLPEDQELATAAIQTGLLGPNMTGLTLFYGIFVCRRAQGDNMLIAHECRHVHQYEQKGSVAGFLQEYLQQIVTFGYVNAPLERDARSAAANARLV